MSPRNSRLFGCLLEFFAGNERTSVGLFFLRYVLFKRAISASVMKAMFAELDFSFNWRKALRENLSSGRRASLTFFCLLRIVTSKYDRDQFPDLPLVRWGCPASYSS